MAEKIEKAKEVSVNDIHIKHPLNKVKELTEQELQERAKQYFNKYPKLKTVFADELGRFFLSYQACHEATKNSSSKVYTINR